MSPRVASGGVSFATRTRTAVSIGKAVSVSAVHNDVENIHQRRRGQKKHHGTRGRHPAAAAAAEHGVAAAANSIIITDRQGNTSGRTPPIAGSAVSPYTSSSAGCCGVLRSGKQGLKFDRRVVVDNPCRPRVERRTGGTTQATAHKDTDHQQWITPLIDGGRGDHPLHRRSRRTLPPARTPKGSFS